MSQFDVQLRAAGLWPDPNPHTDVPLGGLLRADDVVIRRTGVVQPRPGLEDQSFATAVATSRRIQALHPYDGDFVATTKASTDKLLNKNGAAITLGGNDIDFVDHHVHSAVARDRLYMPTADGPIRLQGADTTTAEAMGLPRAKSGYGEAVAGDRAQDEWLADSAGTVAYRCILADEEADGELRVSPPSGRWYVGARTGGGNDSVVSLTIPVHSGWAGYQLRVYRSETSGVNAPSDEMARVMTHEITAAEAAAGKVVLTDTTAATDRGESLYTNATQVGAEGEYRQPPQLGTMCWYRDMMFGGRVESRHSMTIQFTVVPTNLLDSSDSTYAVDLTSGSTALANEGWTTSEDVYGLSITEAGSDPNTADTYFPADCRVGYDGADWTLSDDALATSTAVSVSLHEWISLGVNSVGQGSIYFQGDATLGDGDLENGLVSSNDAGLGAALYSLERVIGSTAAALNFLSEDITATHLGNGLLLIEAVDVGTDFTISMPRRLAQSTELLGLDDEYDGVGGRASTNDAKPHRLVWSALQIPEGFPPFQFLDLGSESHPILALVPTRYGVYVFKYDGIWRIDGRTPEGLTSERIDEARIAGPKAAAAYGDHVYAWTDQGVVRVGPGGVDENLSAQQLEVWLGELERALPEEATPGAGVFLMADRGSGVIYLGAPASASSDDTTEWVYVFDVKARSWTRWSLAATHAAIIDGRLHTATYESSTGVLRRARLASDDYPHHDDSFSLTLDSVTVASGVASLVNVAVTGSTPVVGDWIVFRGEAPPGEGFPATFRGAVASFDSGSGAMTVRLAESFTVGVGSELTGTLYQGPDCVVEWMPRTAQNPMMTKLWNDVILSFEQLDRFYVVDWEYRGTLTETPSSITWTRTPETDRARPESWFGGFVPRNQARAEQLFCRATLHNPGATWALTGLQVRYNPTGTRPGRRAP